MQTFGDRFPDNTTTDNVYHLRPAQHGFAAGDNYGWTTSFWSGLLWLAYEMTGDAIYRQQGERHIQNFANRVHGGIDLDTHDLGFLYTLSCIAPYRLTGSQQAKKAALKAADYLMKRYLENIGVFQAWGHLEDPALRGNTIIDSLMNMPLLYWAGDMIGDDSYAKAANRHVSQLRDYVVRPDYTTFHMFYWNTDTGEPLYGRTMQGYADDSCWARGQAWAIYGFTLNYHYTGDKSFLETAQGCADYFIAHLPDDAVIHWDLAFGRDSDQQRDSSAAAIAVCGLLELAKQVDDPAKCQAYQQAAEDILTALMTNYTACDKADSNALLLHSVYDMPKLIGVDEGSLWGDYFFMEALVRLLKPDWHMYW